MNQSKNLKNNELFFKSLLTRTKVRPSMTRITLSISICLPKKTFSMILFYPLRYNSS